MSTMKDLVLAPMKGFVFIMFLPAIGFVLTAQALWKKALEVVRV